MMRKSFEIINQNVGKMWHWSRSDGVL